LLIVDTPLLCFVGALWDDKNFPLAFFLQVCKSRSSSFFHSTSCNIFQ
jgi:hypothetical protein